MFLLWFAVAVAVAVAAVIRRREIGSVDSRVPVTEKRQLELLEKYPQEFG